jgi:thioesterase domain-containing protein
MAPLSFPIAQDERSTAALQSMLRTRIPLADFMQLAIDRADNEAVYVSAPLAPNLNVHGTVFGGSLTAVGLLAGWSLLTWRMQGWGLAGDWVVARHEAQFMHPVSGRFQACASLADQEAWSGFVETLHKQGRAPIAVTISLAACDHPEQTAARLLAKFVAVQVRQGTPSG